MFPQRNIYISNSKEAFNQGFTDGAIRANYEVPTEVSFPVDPSTQESITAGLTNAATEAAAYLNGYAEGITAALGG